MHYYFITGTSSGIGKELALQIVARPNTHVFGISRRCTVEHKQYQHVFADMTKVEDLQSIFDLFKTKFTLEDTVYLINNAGCVDLIRYAGSFSQVEIHYLMQVNLISTIQLINAFLVIPLETIKNRVILTVSSGAASKVIDGWSLYGAAKAGIDHFSLHVAHEIELRTDIKTRIFSIAPGVVDTPMQQKIRETAESSFSTKQKFIELLQNKALVSPQTAALNYLKILDAPELYVETVFSLRELYSK